MDTSEFTKRCCECRQFLGADAFYKCSAKKDGLAAKCKDCDREYQRYYRENNREYFRESSRKERAEKPELNQARTRRWREKNAERKAAINKAWREANKGREAQTGKAWYEANRGRTLELTRAWYQNNKERKSATNKRWRENNPEKIRLNASARRVDGSGMRSVARLWDMYREQSGRCFYCEAALDGVFEVDHMTPVARGGNNEDSNLVLACFPCNRSKGTKTAEEFFAWR